jgi:predicted metal-dependent peptidase
MDKKVIRAKVQLMLDRPFYGSLVARLQLREWDKELFATDGEFLFVPKDHKYDDEMLESVVAHETWHCALLHPFRRGKRDHFRWNVACDYVINDLLVRDGFKIHSTWLQPESQYMGLSAEQVYEKLPPQIKTHIIWLDIVERSEGSGQSEGKGKGKKGKKMEGGEGETRKTNADLEQEWKEILSTSIEQGRGYLPAGFEEQLTDYMFPQIPWQTLLFRHLQTSKGSQDFRSYPFNRSHIWRGVYLPSLQGDFIELNVAWDTSGSMSNKELSEGLSETMGMCANFGGYLIHLYMCDAEVHQVIDIEDISEIPKVAVGRGGTSFIPVFDKMRELQLDEHPLVYFTDLEGSFPLEPKDDTFWIVPERSKKHEVPFGEKIVLN